MKMYKSCVNGMINNGIDQWDENYPNSEIISQDLKNKTYYVAEEKEEIIGGINIDQNQDITYLDLSWKDTSNLEIIKSLSALAKAILASKRRLLD